jgi:hypothetical protein
MGTNEEILRKNQAGIETTRGTGVAATRIVYATMTPSFERPIREFTDTSGTFDGNRRVAYQRQRGSFAMTDLATFEDLPWWWQFGIKGGVSGGAGDAGTPVMYTYTFTPSLATDDIKAMTLEWNEQGNPYKSTQVMLNDWTLRIEPDSEGAWILDGNLLARDIATTTYTGALSDRTTEVIPAPGTKLYIDDSTIGSSQVTAKFISASVTFNQNIHYKAFGEDVTAYAANKVGRGKRAVDGQIVLEFDSDTEFAKYRSATPVQRFIRLESAGSVIHDAVTKLAQVNVNGYWSTIGWGNREGNIIATFGFKGFYNAVAGYTLQGKVQNALATLP